MSETEHEPEPQPGEDPDQHEGDGGSDTPAEPEEEQTPAEAAAIAGSDEVLKKADAANRRYHTQLAKILGPDANRHECPKCNGLGVTWGEEPELPELQQAPDAEACPTCAALGVMLTGSHNPQQATKPCPDCGGRGWRNIILPPPTPLPVAAPITAPNIAQAGQWVPGRGFIPYGATDPVVPDTSGGVQ